MKRSEVIVVIIACVVCFGTGFALGYNSAMDLCIDLAFRFTDISEIKIDSDILNQIIGRYGDRI